jgi:hypothetical protein
MECFGIIQIQFGKQFIIFYLKIMNLVDKLKVILSNIYLYHKNGENYYWYNGKK